MAKQLARTYRPVVSVNARCGGDCGPSDVCPRTVLDDYLGLLNGCVVMVESVIEYDERCVATKTCTVNGAPVDCDSIKDLPDGVDPQLVYGCMNVAIDPASITAAFEAALVDLPTLIGEAVANAATSTAVPGQPCCVLIDGAPGFATPVSVLAADGSVVSVTWLSGDGQAIAGTVAPAAPADCDCLLAAACADCP